MLSDLQSVLDAIPRLSSADRQAVVDRCQVLGVGKIARDTKEEVLSIIKQLTELQFPPLPVLQHSKQFTRFSNGVKELERFLSEAFSKKLDHKEYHKARLRVLYCIIGVMRRKKVPLTLGNIGSGMLRSFEIIEECFPGYMECGLLHFILFSEEIDESDDAEEEEYDDE